jgi:hypothetical protein
LKRFHFFQHYSWKEYTMGGNVSLAVDAVYEILITDADGQHLELERFSDLDAARRRLPAVAAQYPGTKLALRNRRTRAILAETDGY